MKLLIANLGSTSFKYRLFDMSTETQLAHGGIDRIGGEMSECFVEIGSVRNASQVVVEDHSVAVQKCLDQLTDPRDGCLKSAAEVSGIGFKAVHGGFYSGVQLVTPDVLNEMESMGEAAPAHNPPYVAAMRLLGEQFPDLPLINDPSHITGKRDMIFDVSQTALDLNFDGLMIETHYDPDNAWSDAKQQITPETLDQLTADLTIRKEEGDALEYLNKLANLRTQIDIIDHKLTEILGKRMKIADEIGALKKKNNVAILQNKRWNEILSKMILEGKEFDLSEEFILKIYKY
jgi:chorismate mutase